MQEQPGLHLQEPDNNDKPAARVAGKLAHEMAALARAGHLIPRFPKRQAVLAPNAVVRHKAEESDIAPAGPLKPRHKQIVGEPGEYNARANAVNRDERAPPSAKDGYQGIGLPG